MADMTLEKAERILAKARRWISEPGMSDLQIAKKMHTSTNNGAFSMTIFFFVAFRFSGFRDNIDWFRLCLGIGIILFVCYLFFESTRYSKIRDLFEKVGPQNIKDLKISPPADSIEIENSPRL